MLQHGPVELVFIDDVNADWSSRIYSEVYRAVLWMDNKPKHSAKATTHHTLKNKPFLKYILMIKH